MEREPSISCSEEAGTLECRREDLDGLVLPFYGWELAGWSVVVTILMVLVESGYARFSKVVRGS